MLDFARVELSPVPGSLWLGPASMLQPKDAGDGSAVFNIARNLGGSVGTAMLGTIITRREQFHDFEIGAYINAYRPVVQERVQTLATTFFNKGYDAVTATHQAFGQINDIARREMLTMLPLPCRSKARISYFMLRSTPSTFVSKMA